MWVLSTVQLACLLCVVSMISMTRGQSFEDQTCLLDNAGKACSLGRPPIYMVLAPRRVRAGQVVQVFATILRMEFGRYADINVRVSITQGFKELAFSEVLFERPSSRMMQLLVPENTPDGNYRLRLEGTLRSSTFGNIFQNETDIEFTTKQASLFIQMSKPLYRQGDKVQLRVVPILPDLMQKHGSMTVYIEDPNGVTLRRWIMVQTNAGGLVAREFQLSDQPTYGTWKVKLDAFGHKYQREFQVEEFWEPRFDVNVSVPNYLIENTTEYITGKVLANHTSGRPCKGNASVTAFFMPREAVWNQTKGWLKAFEKRKAAGLAGNEEPPEYFRLSALSPKDFHMYLEYDYRFIDYFDGHIDFSWSFDDVRYLGQRAGDSYTIVGSAVMFFVNVTDWYTSLNRTGWASTTIYDSRVKLHLIGSSVRSFKPLSEFAVQVAIARYDGTRVVDNKPVMFEVAMSNVGPPSYPDQPSSITPVNGIATFQVLPQSKTEHISVRASYYDGTDEDRYKLSTFSGSQFSNDRLSVVELKANRYYSLTKNYIIIRTSTEHPRVNEYMIFHVMVSQFVPRIFYQVVAQGNIIIGDELEMTSKQKTFAVALSREMMPTARLVVYFIRQPEEIVSDVMNFFVNGTGQNEVRLGINQGKDFSRDTVEFNAYADPGSYVAFSGMLDSLYNRGLNDGITENKLIDELETYDKAAKRTYRHLWRISDTEYEYKFFPGGDYGIDPNTSFHDAGLIVLTDANLARIPNLDDCLEGEFHCLSDANTESCHPIEAQCNGKFDACQDGSDEFGCDYHNNTMMALPPLHHMSRIMRYYDNSSWAWQEIFVKPNGRVDFRVPVPKYPLKWVVNGLSMSHNFGLGIMRRPVIYDATRFMYIMVEHPKVIVRGEQIGVRVTVFNYWYDDDYIEVLVTMHASKDCEFVMVEDLGYVSSYNPRTHKGDHQTIVFLEPGESKDIYMPIVPAIDLMRGEMNFHVSATAFLAKDDYYGTMQVIPDGVINYYHIPYLVDLIRFATIDVPDFKVPVPEQFRVPGQWRYSLYIPGSAQACVSSFGDIVTPGFFENYLNAENVLWRPYGGGEQITFNFAYNLMTLQFMKKYNQLSNERLAIALDEMNIAFQRMTSYMNPVEGSFKMFRDDPASSLWLTAFVAKTLHWARFGEWERQLFISVDLLNTITLYMCSRQNQTTGAFIPDDNPAYDYKMASLKQGQTGLKMTDPIALTSYVLIALYKLKDVSGTAAHCRDNAKRRAVDYLVSQVDNIPEDEVFILAISSYALSFGKQGRIKSINKLFAQMRNDSSALYFADQKVWENPSEFLTNIRYLKSRQELMNDAYAVHTTAYALMSYMKQREQDSNTTSLMAWLHTMRNTIGGFSSTQDTIIAMEALYEFAAQDKNRNIFNLDFTMWSTSSAGWKRTVALRQDHYTFLTKDCIPVVWGAIRSKAQGIGRALLQLTTTVNVEYEFLLKPTQQVDMTDRSEEADHIRFFDLIIEDIQWHGRNFSIMEMRPCVTWLYTDRGHTTGMSVLEIDIPTGYVIMNDTLRDYVRSGVVPNLKRAEFYGRKVVFYFSYVDTSRTCVFFRADRWYPVANTTIQNRMRVYDYYEPGMHNTTMYTTFNLFQQNICYSCGSYQCPYCPYFNVAMVIKATFTLVGLILGFLLKCFILRS
ncbi:CD109 antigen-like [Littorina saxatilis]|uniref:CD109 antigen n=1 Tax=Littorina saxatilis TaxID=31220 RepID=A0AAN9C505_9CAEN